MHKYIRNFDFLLPLLIGLLMGFQSFQRKAFDEVFIILFVSASFAMTRWRYLHGSDEYKKECEEIIKKRRDDAKKAHLYDGFGVSWGSITSASILIGVVVAAMSYIFYYKFQAQEFIIAFCLAGIIAFCLRVLRYLAAYFFWDVFCGIVVVAVFVFFSKIL